MAADDMEQVVDKVQERWLGSIDKEEPEIADEFYHKMRDAIRLHMQKTSLNTLSRNASDSPISLFENLGISGNRANSILSTLREKGKSNINPIKSLNVIRHSIENGYFRNKNPYADNSKYKST